MTAAGQHLRHTRTSHTPHDRLDLRERAVRIRVPLQYADWPVISGRYSSRFHRRNPGSSHARFQPQNASSTRSPCTLASRARKSPVTNACRAAVIAATEMSSQNTCAASVTTPQIRGPGPPPAWISAIDPPSLCPTSTARRTRIASSTAGKTSSASSCMYVSGHGGGRDSEPP